LETEGATLAVGDAEGAVAVLLLSPLKRLHGVVVVVVGGTVVVVFAAFAAAIAAAAPGGSVPGMPAPVMYTP
jgi:hypothetical protein